MILGPIFGIFPLQKVQKMKSHFCSRRSAQIQKVKKTKQVDYPTLQMWGLGRWSPSGQRSSNCSVTVFFYQRYIWLWEDWGLSTWNRNDKGKQIIVDGIHWEASRLDSDCRILCRSAGPGVLLVGGGQKGMKIKPKVFPRVYKRLHWYIFSVSVKKEHNISERQWVNISACKRCCLVFHPGSN